MTGGGSLRAIICGPVVLIKPTSGMTMSDTQKPGVRKRARKETQPRVVAVKDEASAVAAHLREPRVLRQRRRAKVEHDVGKARRRSRRQR